MARRTMRRAIGPNEVRRYQLGAIVPMEDLERLRALEAGDHGRAMQAYRASWRRVTEALHRR